MRVAIATALACLAVAGTAVACPASFVTNLYNSGTSVGGTALSGEYIDKAGEVADGYMRGRGLEPNSPSGDIIRPYIGGTAIVEDYWNDQSTGYSHIDMDDATDTIVNEALGDFSGQPAVGTNPNGGGHGLMDSDDHFETHFGNGVADADEQGEVTDLPPPADRKGG